MIYVGRPMLYIEVPYDPSDYSYDDEEPTSRPLTTASSIATPPRPSLSKISQTLQMEKTVFGILLIATVSVFGCIVGMVFQSWREQRARRACRGGAVVYVTDLEGVSTSKNSCLVRDFESSFFL